MHINIRQILDQQNILFQLLQVVLEFGFTEYFRNRVGHHRQALVHFLQLLPVVLQALFGKDRF